MSILKDNIPIDCLLFPNSHYISTAPFIFHAFGILKLTQYEACFPDLFRSFAIQEKINLKKQTVIMMHEHPFAQFHFCPKCGSPRFVEHNEKSKQCEDCGFVYYFNPQCSHCRGHPERTTGTVGLPQGKGTGQRHARPARRILGLFREQRGRSGTGSKRRNRVGSNPHGIPVFPAQHLPVFRISGTYRRLFLPLYGGRQ